MRPPRVIIAAAFCVTTLLLTFTSLRSSRPSHTVSTTAQASPGTGIQSFFFRAPFSLFPPNAIITLVHDNTTAFLARPAAFGPSLPTRGLKGQVWIGSGFGDDSIRQGAVYAGAEGELGCSDVPGWVDSFSVAGAAKLSSDKGSDASATKSKSRRRSHDDGPFGEGNTGLGSDDDAEDRDAELNKDDGTDDYLHHPLLESSLAGLSDKQPGDASGDHADIQSIQEGAEITGKIVLLSRGGCGFLEKVKWAQRRGAIALIVGDNMKGGPLIQMYARGDTSNVTIPAIFTSRTTAHLLSSLIGTGTFIQDTGDEQGKPRPGLKQTEKPKHNGKKCKSGPTFTRATGTKATMMARSQPKARKPLTKEEKPALNTKKPSWFKSFFFGAGRGSSKSDSSRPPSSGQLDWVLVDDWKDDGSSGHKKASAENSKATSGSSKKSSPKGSSKPASGDDFVIGVQDWRDPDLVGSKDGQNGKGLTGKVDAVGGATKVDEDSPRPTKAGKKHLGGALQVIPEYVPPLRGGSITPGSGEYGTKASSADGKSKSNKDQTDAANKGKSKGILTTIFGDDEEEMEYLVNSPGNRQGEKYEDSNGDCEDDDEEYDGLWVTLTPTSGASPFLDTLLVLVVSPLVTLTVVYALLLIRSRIRRRRWRAPKSVVERLPVRTYQTVATPGNQSPRLPNPASNSPMTPLLQSPSARPRPRSRTTSGIPEPGDLARVNSQPLQVPGILSSDQEENITNSISSEWKKYMGKQVECVVCLEEYIDGVSRVMSLPCGHEFHVDCITPWLTTRRRTCPICKGDVVRSLARGSPSSPRYEAYHDDSDSDTTAVPTTTNSLTTTANATPTPAMAISGRLAEADEDLEQGRSSPTPARPRRTRRTASWRTLIASSWSSTGRSPRSQPQELLEEEDRDR